MTGLPPSPWTGRARLTVVAALGLGLALVVAGYAGAAGERSVDDGIVWLNLAVVGVLVASIAEISFLLIGRRQVSLLRREALPALASHTATTGRASEPPGRPLIPAGGAPVSRPVLVPGGTVTVAGSTWYHRPDCLLVSGKAMAPARPADGLAACAVCRPGAGA